MPGQKSGPDRVGGIDWQFGEALTAKFLASGSASSDLELAALVLIASSHGTTADITSEFAAVVIAAFAAVGKLP